MKHTERCRICGRKVTIDGPAVDASGRAILAFHYTKTKKECPGSGRAAYLPGEYPSRKKGKRP